MVTRTARFKGLTGMRAKRKESYRAIAGRKLSQLKLKQRQKKQAGQRRTRAARKALAQKRLRQQQARAVQININLPTARAIRQIKKQTAVPSSNIWQIGYDMTTKILIVDFNSGARYRFFEVPMQVADLLFAGAASCRTTGSSKWGRWHKGKNPSIGAAFWQHIRGRYRYERLSGPKHALPMRAIPSKPISNVGGWKP